MAVEPFPEQFFTSVRKALSVFDALKADWMFIGAVSVATWGRVRATTDADFAVSLDLMAAPELDAGMKGAGFDKESGPQEIPGKRLILSKYWAPGPGGGFGIDVFYTSGYDTGRFLGSALSRRIPVTFHGATYWTTTAEDLIVFKILAFRSRDIDDVAGVFERRFDQLDWAYVLRWCRELKIDSLLRQVVGEYLKDVGREGAWPWKGE
jgi:hypothetical protein